MPTIRKLAPEEVQTILSKGKGPRKLAEEQYDALLSDFAVGDYAEAELSEDEKRLTVRNRLKTAAARRGVAIEFKRTQGDIIRFRIVASGHDNGRGARPVIPEVISAVPPKRKGGRPRKTT